MKNYIKYIVIVLIPAMFFFACKKDNYRNDGGVSDGHVNMTTYDFLKSNPTHLFDSLIKIIDKAGMKDAINGDVTFFATTNYGVTEFMKARKFANGVLTGDENSPYSIDSIPAAELADSLKIYIYPGKITRDQIRLEGTLYDCALGPIPNIKFMIKMKRVTDDLDLSAYLDRIDYVTFAKVIGSRDDLQPDPDAVPQEEKDISFRAQTSNLITTNGVVHVLEGSHRLFFNAGPQGN